MKNSPYANVSDMLKDAQTILSNKKLWTDAKDDATRENIRFQTEPIYERLRRNGYGDVAKNLTASNYEQALSVVDALSKSNEPLRTVTYTPDDDVKNIYNNKERWGNATDEKEKQTIANQTQAYYNSLRDNGYNDVAHSLSTANYEQSKPIYDKWMKMGKTATRDYLYTLGQKYGMSTEDVDKLIQWDNDSKELTFGGVKVGSPDAIVDGVSYWTENNLPKLEKAFKDYINASGTTLSGSKLVDLNNNGVNQKIDELWGTINGDRDKYYSEYDKVSDYANKDVTKTDEYQSTFKNIMGKYDLSAMQGRDNAVASGGASNGGNIDSYAAANAMRQQMAITAEGQALAHQLGLEAYQSRMDNTRQLLSDLGIYQKDSWNAMGDVIDKQQTEAQRLFENEETAKNNEVARLKEQSAVTGYSPNAWIEEGAQRTADYDLTKQQIDSAERISKETNKASVDAANKELEANKYVADKNLEANKYVADKEAEVAMLSAANVSNYESYDTVMRMFDVSDTGPRNFMEEFIKPIYEGESVVSEESLKSLIVSSSAKYNLDVEDARTICKAFGIDTKWLDDYRDRTNKDGSVEVDGKMIEGQYAGMVKK